MRLFIQRRRADCQKNRPDDKEFIWDSDAVHVDWVKYNRWHNASLEIKH
jgi:hypothetical protein